jgi:hypothetical protein
MPKLTIPQRQPNQDDATYAQIVQNSIREQRPYLSDDDILSLAQVKISSAPSVQLTAQPKAQEVAKVEAPKPIKPAVEVVSKVVPKQVTPPKTLAEVARGLANKKVVTDPMESGIVARQETIKKLPEQPAIMPSLGDPKVAAKVAKMYETFVGSPKQPQPPVELTGKDFAAEETRQEPQINTIDLPTQVSEQPINQGLKPEKGVVIGGQAEDIRQQLLSKKTSSLETNQNPFAAPQKEVFTIEGIKEKISNLPKIRREEKVELPKIDIFDAEAEKQLPKGSPTEKAVYAKVLRDNDDKIKTFEASKVAAQMPTSDFEATINKKDLSFGNTQRASLMKAKFGGDMTAIEGSLNEYQETPEFKRDVIKAANGNKAKFNEAAQLVLDNKANEYAFAPTKLQKKMQQFSDWTATNNIPLDYAVTKTLGAGLKGLTDVGAFGAALIGGTARSMGQVLEGKGEISMLNNFAAANAKAQQASRGYIPQVQSEKASGLTQGLSDVTSIVAAIATPMSAIKPVTMFTKAKNFLSLGARGESAIAKGLSAEAQLAARATSGANKTLLEAAKTLQSKPANMVAQVLDNAATNWAIMGSSSFDGQRQKYLDMGFNEEQANRRAFGMTSLTNLLLAMPNVLRPHEASIAQKIFSTGSKKETLKASLKQAAYFGGDMTLLRSIEGTLDDNARREQGIKIENKPFIEVIKENGAKAIIDGGSGFVMGLMARGKYKQSEMQLNGIAEAFRNPEQLSLDVQKEVANGRLSKEQAKTFQDFLTTIEPQYLKTLNETTDINGVQSPKYTPQTAVKIAIERTKVQQATEALKNLNASVEKKTIYETDKNGNIVEKTVYRHKDGKLYETEETSTKGRRASLLREKSTAEERARRFEAGYNIENKLVSGWEMADLVDANSLNGKAKEGQREAIMANAPYEAVEVNVNDFANQPEIAELVSQIESGKLDVTNVEENNIAPPTIDAEGNVIDGKKIVAKAIVESAFERGGGKITFMKPITNEAYTEAANEAFETKIGDTAPITEGLPENEVIGVNAMSDAFDKVIENGGDAAEGLVEAAKEGLQAFVEPQKVAERLKDIKGEDTFSEPIIEAAVNKAVKAEPIEAKELDFTAKGGNKVVDEKGEPITVFTGTNANRIEDIDALYFESDKTLKEKLSDLAPNYQIFFTDNKKEAQSFGKNVLEAEVLIKNPVKNKADLSKTKSQLLKEGYDGYIWDSKDGRTHYIVFDKSQIKTSPIEAEAKTVEQLRAEEKAEMATIDPNDKEAVKEVYDRYDRLITPLLEKEKAVIKQKTESNVGKELNFTELEDKKIKDIATEANLNVGSYVKSIPTGKKNKLGNSINEYEATNPFTKERIVFKKQGDAADYVVKEIAKATTKSGREEIFNKEQIAAAREKGIKDMSIAEKMRQKAKEAEVEVVEEKPIEEPNEEAVVETPKDLSLTQVKHNRLAAIKKSYNALTKSKKSSEQGKTLMRQINGLATELGYEVGIKNKGDGSVKVLNSKGSDIKAIAVKSELPKPSNIEVERAKFLIEKGIAFYGGDVMSERTEFTSLTRAEVEKGVADIEKGKMTIPAIKLIKELNEMYESKTIPTIQGGGGSSTKRSSIELDKIVEDGFPMQLELTEKDIQFINENEATLAEEYDAWYEGLSNIEKLEHLNIVTDAKETENRKAEINASGESEANVSNEKDAGEKEQQKSKLKEASSFIRDAAAKLREQHEKEINDPNAIQRQGGLSKKQVAIALEKLADIIDTVNDVEKAIKQFLDGIKDPKERTEYEREINNFFVEEYGEKEEVKPVPFAEIPKARVKEIMVEGNKVVDKTLENRLMTGETADSIKQEVEKKGLERVVDDFVTAEANANNIVEKYGYNEALTMAIEGEIDGAARSAILGMEYLRRDNAVRVAKTATELRRATEDLAEWISYVGYLQAKGGSANAYWGKFYADNPNLGLTLKDKIDKWEQTSGKAIPIDIKEKYEQLDTQLKEALQRVKELEEQAPTDEMKSAIKAIQEQEAKKSSKPTLTKEQRNRTSDKLMALAEKIRKSENSGLVLSTPIPPHIISDSVKLLAQGVKVGEAIGDTMAKIYKLIEGGIKKKLTEEERKKVSDYFTAQLEESVETDNVSGNPITNSVIRDYVLQGFNTPEKLLEKLMEHYPNKSERNVRDLVSKYGQEITKTADEIDREISLIKNVFKTESQLEDIAQGVRPKKRVVPQVLTFAERAAEEVRSAKKRRNLKNVRQALDKLNADLPALDNELRNKLDKQEATLSNKIKDLELAIEDGKEITKSEKTKLTSEEIERLELQLDETRTIYNEVFGKKPMTEGERKLKSLETELKSLYKEKEGVEKAEPKYTTSEKIDIEALQNEIAARKKALRLEGSEIKTAEQKLKEQKVPYSLDAVNNAIYENNKKLKGAQEDLEVVKKRGQDTSKIEADIERYSNNIETLSELRTGLESIEAERVLQTFKNLAKRKEYYEQRKASGQYAKKPKNVLPETTELTKARSEVDRLKFEEQKLMYLAEKQAMSGTAKVGELISGLWNVPRLALATGEWSFVGMQGRRLTASYLIKNPKVVKEAFKNAAKSWYSGELAQELESRIKNSPEYHIYKGSGLDLTEQSFKTAANEEIAYNNIGKILWRFLNSGDLLAEKIYKYKTGKDLGLVEEVDKFNPLVKFERAASGYLNTLRFAAMTDMVSAFKQEGLSFEKNKETYKAAAKYINTATGRGSIKQLEQSSEILAKFFFSPKMFISEIQLATNPLGGAYLAAMKDPTGMARKEAFNHQLRYMSVLLGAGLSATILAYLRMGRTDENEDGTGVEFNPASANFGKIVFPNNRTVDFFNGAQRYVVVADRLFGQEKFKNRKGAIKDIGIDRQTPSKWDVIANIPKNKLNPALGFLTGELDAATRKDGLKYDDYGNVWNTEDEFAKLLSPIFAQMMNNAYEQDPTILDGFGAFMAFFGKGFNVQEKEVPKPPKFKKRKSNYGFRYNP